MMSVSVKRRRERRWVPPRGFNAVIDVVPHPLPQAVLADGASIRAQLRAPAAHHFALDHQEADALTQNEGSPVVANPGARIDEPKGDVPGQELELTEVDRLERPALARETPPSGPPPSVA
jgi:hypothetical protein